MKVGEELSVYVEGIAVAKATITALDTDTVTFVIPGTEVVVGIKHQLTEETPEYVPEVDRVLLDEVDKPAEPSPLTVDNPEPVSLRNMDLDSSLLDDEPKETKND